MNSSITLEALYILDAIERRGSFAAASQELDKAPSSLTYQVQKLEQDLDITIFDRSGHKASFTEAGKLILERGRLILAATQKLVDDASLLANGWELDIAIAYDGVVPVRNLYGLVDELGMVSKTRVKLQEEILAGGWEALNSGRADLLICPHLGKAPQDVKSEVIGKTSMVWVAKADHYVHARSHRESFDEEAQQKYRIIAIADTAREQAPLSINVLEKQPRLTVTNFQAKVDALVHGLGIGTLPKQIAVPLIENGDLKQIEGTEEQAFDISVNWRRNQMGEAKSWCIQYLKKKFPLKA